MSFSMAPLLIHNEAVSEGARSALRAALTSESTAHRTELLTQAAHLLHSENGLDCTDIRELVGLPDDCQSTAKQD
jgi:hypothetical protein